jgi:acetone carboxylase gamma subunit
MTGSMYHNILPTVTTDGVNCACAACGHALGSVSLPWKTNTLRRDLPLAQAGGMAYDTGYPGVVLRQFICPGCATLLDTETATAGDPALDDRLIG